MTNDDITEKRTDANVQLPALSPWQGHIEVITKVGVAILGVSYIIGLLILNMHIRKYGVNYLGFLQIEYVMVGILWAFLVGAMGCALLLFKYIGNEVYKKEWKSLSWLRRFAIGSGMILISLLGTCAIFYHVLNALSDSELSFTSSPFWLVLGVLFINAIMILLLSSRMGRVVKHFYSKESADKRDKAQMLMSLMDIVYHITILVGALSIYSNYAFPTLSPVFGGGKKQKAELVIKAEQKETISAIGLQVASNNRSVGPLEVIFEASDFFLLAPPQQFNNAKVKAIRLNKDLVDAALYISEK